MSLGAADIDFARDLFSEIPDLATRRMFGGLGIYCGDTIFALMLSDGRLMLKAQGGFAQRLAGDGAEQWTYTRKNGASAAMPYWTLPEAAMEDPEQALALARDAIDALRQGPRFKARECLQCELCNRSPQCPDAPRPGRPRPAPSRQRRA